MVFGENVFVRRDIKKNINIIWSEQRWNGKCSTLRYGKYILPSLEGINSTWENILINSDIIHTTQHTLKTLLNSGFVINKYFVNKTINVMAIANQIKW